MFLGAKAFNQPIGSWDVRRPASTRASLLIEDSSTIVARPNASSGPARAAAAVAPRASLPCAGARDRHVRAAQVSGVTSTRYMFREARAFDQDIGSWDVRDPRRLERAFP